MKYIWSILFTLLMVAFAILAFRGSDIHDSACPDVKTARVRTVIAEDERYTCLPSDCVRDGKVYEIYEQQGFFNSTYRVKEIDVVIIKETTFPSAEENMTAIESGVDGHSKAYYATIPTEGLNDGEAVHLKKE